MRIRQLDSFGLGGIVPVLAFLSALGFATGAASASTISIAVSVVDLVFDGTDLVDAGSPAHGSGDIADADLVDTMVFQVDGSTVATLTSPPDDLGVDIYIPSISPIPAAGGSGVSAPGGTLDLLTSSIVPGYGLELELGAAGVHFFPGIGTFDFVFVGTVASVGLQSLPLGLEIGDPVNVTLSLQATSVSTSGGFLDGFEAFGSGEVTGDLEFDPNEIPEPSTMALGGLALLLLGAGQARRRRS